MTNSRAKGARFERLVASLLRDAGFQARRTQQYSGTAGDSDVTVDDLPRLFIECKDKQAMNSYKVMTKAVKQMHQGQVPVIVHTRNGEEILATLRLEDFLEMLRELVEYFWEKP